MTLNNENGFKMKSKLKLIIIYEVQYYNNKNNKITISSIKEYCSMKNNFELCIHLITLLSFLACIL